MAGIPHGPVVMIEIPAPLSRDGKPAWLLMNHRLHHRPKGVITKAWRAAGKEAAQPAADVCTFTERVHITITAHRTGRVIDADAVAPTAKAAIDGLVDAGLLVDDSPKFVTAVTYRTAPKSATNTLRIEIKETR